MNGLELINTTQATTSSPIVEGAMISVFGILTVFLILVIISIILIGFGKLFTEKKKSVDFEITEKKENVVKENLAVQKKADDLELIAVLTAAIVASERAKGNNISPDKLIVKSFRRVNTWNREAIQEQQSNLF